MLSRAWCRVNELSITAHRPLEARARCSAACDGVGPRSRRAVESHARVSSQLRKLAAVSAKNGCSMEATPPPMMITSGSSRSMMLPSQTDNNALMSQLVPWATRRPVLARPPSWKPRDARSPFHKRRIICRPRPAFPGRVFRSRPGRQFDAASRIRIAVRDSQCSCAHLRRPHRPSRDTARHQAPGVPIPVPMVA